MAGMSAPWGTDQADEVLRSGRKSSARAAACSVPNLLYGGEEADSNGTKRSGKAMVPQGHGRDVHGVAPFGTLPDSMAAAEYQAALNSTRHNPFPTKKIGDTGDKWASGADKVGFRGVDSTASANNFYAARDVVSTMHI
eukprot:jgi/Chlat1/4164/Chrsp27S04267